MDSVPSYEFHKIFRRLSYDVDLRGAFTPEEIDRRLDAVQGYFRNRARRAVSGSEKKRLHKKARAIENLQNKNFAERTIIEARSNRYGIVNLTLNYGRKKAEEIKLAFVRAQERSRGIGRRRLP
jgi:hypothetical protein